MKIFLVIIAIAWLLVLLFEKNKDDKYYCTAWIVTSLVCAALIHICEYFNI